MNRCPASASWLRVRPEDASDRMPRHRTKGSYGSRAAVPTACRGRTVCRSAARPQLPDQHERRTPRNNRTKELEPVARERGAHGMDGSRCSIGQDVPRTGAVSSSLIIANCCARAFFRSGLSGIAASSSATSLFSLCSRSISLWSRSNSRCSCSIRARCAAFGRIRIAPFGKGGLRILAQSGYIWKKDAVVISAKPRPLQSQGFHPSKSRQQHQPDRRQSGRMLSFSRRFTHNLSETTDFIMAQTPPSLFAGNLSNTSAGFLETIPKRVA